MYSCRNHAFTWTVHHLNLIIQCEQETLLFTKDQSEENLLVIVQSNDMETQTKSTEES